MSNIIIDYDNEEKMGTDGNQVVIDTDLMSAIFNLPDLSEGGRYLLFTLSTYPDGYPLGEKELLKRSGLSKSTLIRQRKRLNELGYIRYIPRKEYFIDIERIYANTTYNFDEEDLV